MTYKRWQGPTRPVSNGAQVGRVKLDANVDAPALARAAISQLVDQADSDVLERATLLTSEAVTNAVRYADGDAIRVDVWANSGTVGVVVYDGGPGFSPAVRKTDVPGTGGLGLPLMDMLSEAWGCGSLDRSEAWVWFEVAPRIMERADAIEPPAVQPELLDVRMLVDSIHDHALVALDPHGFVVNWGSVASELTGYSPDEFLGRLLSDLYIPASAKAFARDRAAAEREGVHHSERWIERRDGSHVWVDLSLAPIVARSGDLRGMSALISDLTTRKEADDQREHLISQLRDLAMTDELTALPNRRRWIDELNRELARSRRNGTPLAVAMLDLNGFKSFNDTHGHPAGDELLQRVAREWSEAIRTTDMLARYGGDEFVVSLPDCAPALALAVVARVVAATPAEVAATAGIASSEEGEDADALVKRADDALYAAKRQGRPVAVSGP